MPQYEVVVRVFDIAEVDSVAARCRVEEKFRAAGLSHFQVTHIGLQGQAQGRITPVPPTSPAYQASAAYGRSGLVVVAAVVAWTAWFLWMLVG